MLFTSSEKWTDSHGPGLADKINKNINICVLLFILKVSMKKIDIKLQQSDTEYSMMNI